MNGAPVKICALDTETALIEPGLLAPPLACVSWANEQLGTGLFHWTNAEEIERLLNSFDSFIGANVAYDMGVLCEQFPHLMRFIFDLYRDGKVRDIQIDQKLIDIALGQLGGRWKGKYFQKYFYSLDAIYQRHGGEPLDKNTWRLKYGGLRDTPLANWEPGARKYPEDDAAATMFAHLSQREWSEYLIDSAPQAQAAFALHLQSCYGMRTDPIAVRELKEATEEDISKALKICQAEGLIDKSGKKNLAPARMRMLSVCDKAGIDLKITATGQEKYGVEYAAAKDIQEMKYISLDGDACNTSGDAVLKAFDTYGSARTLRTRVETLEHGTRVPLQTRYDVLKETGRTSSQKPGDPLFGDNFQNPPQKGGYRECFVPRPGFVYCSVDFDMAELRTLAQSCIWILGESSLGEALNAGKDPHLMMAATILGISYEAALARRKAGDKEIKETRGRSKGPNFGLPGGMGPDGLVRYMRASNPPILIKREEAVELIGYWHGTWPEMRDLFAYVKSQMQGGSTTCITEISKRVRGDTPYCSACNMLFQAPMSDAAKAGLLPLARECYVEQDSPLYGSRPVLFLHDEVLAELPEDRAHEAAFRMRDIMVKHFNRYVPQVPVTATPALMRRWTKGAEAIYRDGRLVPWEDRPMDKAA